MAYKGRDHREDWIPSPPLTLTEQFAGGCFLIFLACLLFLGGSVVYIFWYPGQSASLDVRQVYVAESGPSEELTWILYQDKGNYLVVQLPNSKAVAGARLDSAQDQLELSGALSGQLYDHSPHEDSAQLEITSPAIAPGDRIAFVLKAPLFKKEGLFSKVSLDLAVSPMESSRPDQLELTFHSVD